MRNRLLQWEHLLLLKIKNHILEEIFNPEDLSDFLFCFLKKKALLKTICYRLTESELVYGIFFYEF